MTIVGRPVLAEVELGQVPFWRQFLRGFSQCAFQANEITGLVFVVAVAVCSWEMAAFYVISVLLGTLTAKALKADRTLLDLGLFGFNSGLMGLALGNFFQPSTALWFFMAIEAVIVAAVAVAMARWLPVPFLAAPFILMFWVTWLVDRYTPIIKVDLGAFPDEPIQWASAVIIAAGAALFTPLLLSGLLFLLGIAISNWRHAVVAALGAVIAVGLAAQAGVVGGSINSGFVGFNAVLAAVAVYAIVAPDLRLAALGALLATWFFSYINSTAPVPALASGFVLSVWAIIFLAWLDGHFREKEPTLLEQAEVDAFEHE